MRQVHRNRNLKMRQNLCTRIRSNKIRSALQMRQDGHASNKEHVVLIDGKMDSFRDFVTNGSKFSQPRPKTPFP